MFLHRMHATTVAKKPSVCIYFKQQRYFWHRRFGIELETIIPGHRHIANRQELKIHLKRKMKEKFNEWKVVNDSSIHSGRYNTFGAELVSPPLSFNLDSIRLIGDLCNELKKINATTNISTGFHVHCDATNLSTTDIVQYAINYAHFECILDKFVDRSRRGNRNTYCRTMRHIVGREKWKRLLRTDAVQYADLNPGDKYHKLNPGILRNATYPTIENRHHHGTICSDDILYWIRLNLKLMQETVEQGMKHVCGTKKLSPERKQLFWEFVDDVELQTHYNQISEITV